MPKLPNLKLTSALARSTTDFPCPVSISESGKHCYAVYEINVDNTNTLAAEIFRNHDGELVSEQIYNGDTTYYSVDSGSASNDFKLFSVIEDDQNTNVRVRVLNHQLQVVGERIFTDAYLNGYTTVGGVFNHDGSQVSVAYALDNNNPQTYTVKVLKTDANLTSKAEIVINGSVQNQSFLRIKGKTYLAFTIAKGVTDLNEGLEISQQPPYEVRIYRVHHHNLKFVDKITFAQGVNDIPVFQKNHDHAIISAGTYRSLTDCEVNFYDPVDYDQSAKKYGAELVIFKFDGHKIKKLYKKSYNHTVYSPVIHPSGKFLVLSQSESPYSVTESLPCDPDAFYPYRPGFFQLAGLNDDYHVHGYGRARAIPHFNEAVFSGNGKWLFTSGARSTLPDESNPIGLKNIQLYKIVDHDESSDESISSCDSDIESVEGSFDTQHIDIESSGSSSSD